MKIYVHFSMFKTFLLRIAIFNYFLMCKCISRYVTFIREQIMGFRLLFCDLNRIAERRFVMVVNQTGNCKSKLGKNISILIKCEIKDKPECNPWTKTEGIINILGWATHSLNKVIRNVLALQIYVHLTTLIRSCLKVEL